MLRCASGSCRDAAGGASGERVGDRSEHARFESDELEEMWRKSQIIRMRQNRSKAGRRCHGHSKGPAKQEAA
jgi:hypothetical protein